jgi:hypothetical protein
MGWMCDRVVEAGGAVIADFICPTEQTRAVFGEAFTIWLDRIDAGRFADTNRMFVAPEKFDLRVGPDGMAQYWAEQALALLRPAFDPQKPTALFIGRYQPLHGGHQRLIEEGLRRVGQVCVAACRSTAATTGPSPRQSSASGARTPTSPLRIVGSATYVNGFVFYFRDQPSTFDIDNPKLTPRASPDRIRREGAAIVCPETEAFCMLALGGFAAHFPVVADEDAVVSRRFFGFATPLERYEIIVIPPDPS